MNYPYSLVHYYPDKNGNYVVGNVENGTCGNGGFNPARDKTARCYLDTRKTDESGREIYHVFHYDYT